MVVEFCSVCLGIFCRLLFVVPAPHPTPPPNHFFFPLTIQIKCNTGIFFSLVELKITFGG